MTPDKCAQNNLNSDKSYIIFITDLLAKEIEANEPIKNEQTAT